LPLAVSEPLDDPELPVRAAAGFDGCDTLPPVDPLLEEEEELDEPDEPDDPDEPDELEPAELLDRGMACPLAAAGTASPATTANASAG
jgi:hypothetical protein